ncbi:hypothetical protein ANO11243_096730 [Dothideomycetidae sp. 11243]|nr:hypothetical protein ANO11243_096730 [fungal sp. No.11243]
MEKCIQSTSRRSMSEAEDDDTRSASLVDVLQVARRVVACLTQGVDALDLYHASRSIMGSVTYHMTNLFALVLTALTSICESRVNEGLSQPKEPARAKSRLSSNVHQPSIKPNSPAALLTQFLQSMYAILDPRKRHHNDLFEGCTYHLLQSIGKILNSCTSDDNAPPSVIPPAPFLLDILATALSHSPRNFRLRSFHPKNTRSSLTHFALAKLQRTLVHATLGEDLSPLDPAAERIHAPEPIVGDGPKRTRTVKRNDTTANGFKARLWACLGWEILAYEGALAELLAEET